MPVLLFKAFESYKLSSRMGSCLRTVLESPEETRAYRNSSSCSIVRRLLGRMCRFARSDAYAVDSLIVCDQYAKFIMPSEFIFYLILSGFVIRPYL